MDGSEIRRGATEVEIKRRRKRARSVTVPPKPTAGGASNGEASFGASAGLNPGLTWSPQGAFTGSNGVHYSADRPVAVTVSDDEKFNKRTLYISERGGKEHIQLPPHVQFSILPPTDKDAREVLSIAGAAGAGKSFICKEYARRYKQLWKKRDVFVISALNEDKTLDELKFLQRILVRTLVDDPIENAIDAFSDSLCIFDDIEALVGEERRAVSELLDALLTLGRHSRTSVIVASHLPARGKETRLLLSESHRFIVMPHALGFNTLKYLCTTHLGLTPQQISDLRSVHSRWVCLSKSFPQYQLSSGDAKLLK